MKTIEDVINELANTLITKNNAYGDAVRCSVVLGRRCADVHF